MKKIKVHSTPLYHEGKTPHCVKYDLFHEDGARIIYRDEPLGCITEVAKWEYLKDTHIYFLLCDLFPDGFTCVVIEKKPEPITDYVAPVLSPATIAVNEMLALKKRIERLEAQVTRLQNMTSGGYQE